MTPHDPERSHTSDGGVPGVPQPATALATAGFLILAALIGLAILIFAIGGADILARPFLSQMPGVSMGATVSVSLFLMQILICVAVFAVPQLLPSATGTLSLNRPQSPRETYSLIAWATVAFMAVSYVFAFTVFRDQFVADLTTFAPLLRSEAWLVASLSIVAGAPIAEELLFRGLLLGWLLQRGVAFWTAAIGTTVMWTLLHIGYSVVGLFEVFLAGLLLSWAFYLTRSVWVPIIVHATYNTVALVVMMTVIV